MKVDYLLLLYELFLLVLYIYNKIYENTCFITFIFTFSKILKYISN